MRDLGDEEEKRAGFGELFKQCHFRFCEPVDVAQGKLYEAIL